jgi:membrane-bound lytic murein transglycosylase A
VRFSILLTTCVCVLSSALSAGAEAPGSGYEFAGNGKRAQACFSALSRPEAPEAELALQLNATALRQALTRQQAQIRAFHPEWQGGLPLSPGSLRQLSQQLLSRLKGNSPLQWQQLGLKPHLLRGEDGCGNTHFTAYFSPLLSVRSRPDTQYRYPLFRTPRRWPGGKALSRAEIDFEHKLEGLGLELGYARSLLEIFFLQVQGSGLAEYVDTGERVTLQYDTQNGLPYSSVGRALVADGKIAAEQISLNAIRAYFERFPEQLRHYLSQNQSYVFFKKDRRGPVGALKTEVVPEVSVAVDPRYIPLGSLLLAEIPRLDANGEFLGHALKLVVAQDTGGAIRGPGHVDVYMGAGAAAQQQASNLHHYGRLWILLPN